MIGRWQIYGAILLRRMPELIPQMNVIENRVQRVFSAYEVAKSKFSDHELMKLEEIETAKDETKAMLMGETAQDREDKWNTEKEAFKFGDYDDRLTYTHYMFFKQKFSPTDDIERWIVPQVVYDPKLDSHLLDTARRAMKEQLNLNTGYTVIGKIPSSSYSFIYPKKLVDQIGYRGAKIFFLKAVLDTNLDKRVEAIIDERKNEKIRWLTITEARDCVKKNYLRGIEKGLLSETRLDAAKILGKAYSYASSTRNQQKQRRQQ